MTQMATSTFWIIIFALAGGTYLLRLSFILIFSNRDVPPLILRILRFVPAAVLPAIIVPAFVFQDSVLRLSLDNPRLIAGILASLVAWYTKNVLATIGSGMGALWVIQFFLTGT